MMVKPRIFQQDLIWWKKTNLSIVLALDKGWARGQERSRIHVGRVKGPLHVEPRLELCSAARIYRYKNPWHLEYRTFNHPR